MVLQYICKVYKNLGSCNFSTIAAANYSDLSDDAGGLYFSQSENVTLNNVNVKNVTSHGNGGCVWMEEVDFYASGDGGVVLARDDSQIEIVNGIFENNNGGAMAI